MACWPQASHSSVWCGEMFLPRRGWSRSPRMIMRLCTNRSTWIRDLAAKACVSSGGHGQSPRYFLLSIFPASAPWCLLLLLRFIWSTERDTHPTSADLALEAAPQPGLGSHELRWVSHVGSGDPDGQPIISALPGHVSRELDRKQVGGSREPTHWSGPMWLCQMYHCASLRPLALKWDMQWCPGALRNGPRAS